MIEHGVGVGGVTGLELCQITNNQINHNLIKIIQLSLTIFDLWSHSHLWVVGWMDILTFFGHFSDILDLETCALLQVIFDICHFLTIPGPFEYFQKMGALRKSKFSR